MWYYCDKIVDEGFVKIIKSLIIKFYNFKS